MQNNTITEIKATYDETFDEQYINRIKYVLSANLANDYKAQVIVNAYQSYIELANESHNQYSRKIKSITHTVNMYYNDRLDYNGFVKLISIHI